MRIFLAAFALAAFALTGGAAFAEQTPTSTDAGVGGTAPAPAVSPGLDRNEVVCKYETRTGSHFSTRICHTRAQWDQMLQDARDRMNNMDGSRQINPAGG